MKNTMIRTQIEAVRREALAATEGMGQERKTCSQRWGAVELALRRGNPADALTAAQLIRDDAVRAKRWVAERATGAYDRLLRRIGLLGNRSRTSERAMRDQLIDVEVALNEERYPDVLRLIVRVHKDVDVELERLGPLPRRPKSAYGRGSAALPNKARATPK